MSAETEQARLYFDIWKGHFASALEGTAFEAHADDARVKVQASAIVRGARAIAHEATAVQIEEAAKVPRPK